MKLAPYVGTDRHYPDGIKLKRAKRCECCKREYEHTTEAVIDYDMIWFDCETTGCGGTMTIPEGERDE